MDTELCVSVPVVSKSFDVGNTRTQCTHLIRLYVFSKRKKNMDTSTSSCTAAPRPSQSAWWRTRREKGRARIGFLVERGCLWVRSGIPRTSTRYRDPRSGTCRSWRGSGCTGSTLRRAGGGEDTCNNLLVWVCGLSVSLYSAHGKWCPLCDSILHVSYGSKIEFSASSHCKKVLASAEFKSGSRVLRFPPPTTSSEAPAGPSFQGGRRNDIIK